MTKGKDFEISEELLAKAQTMADDQTKFLDGTNEINPNWIKAQGYVLDQVKITQELNTTIEVAKKKLSIIAEETQALKDTQNNTYHSGILKYNNELVSIAQTSPNIKLNIAIGLILGLMIGVFYVFAKEWWKNSKDDIKTRWNQYK